MTDEQKSQQMIINIVRGFGAVMMLGGVAIGFNAGGIATMLDLGGIEPWAGAAFFGMGALDFLVVPMFLFKNRKGE